MQLKLLAQREQEATAALIAHLAVLDERGLYLAEGCSSMFTYCLQVLHLSEHAAYGRIEAARAARKYPIILELLGNGSVNLTTVTLLAPHLTAENHIDLFGRPNISGSGRSRNSWQHCDLSPRCPHRSVGSRLQASLLRKPRCRMLRQAVNRSILRSIPVTRHGLCLVAFCLRRLHPLHAVLWSSLLRPRATECSSRPVQRHMRSCWRPRICFVPRSQTATSGRSSIGP